ncbi:GMC family oxidoreductase N-terminal domain-containing protein [Actinoplanes bogorensis]|uniref:GMC family oxidoreductase N-terminal domain-containing protein n=1 Tax=Paractinoplanes bogorensis TaxID=1610840 RepID=A0ABS5YGJ3_9ACTN|nr:GMC family oxidoreductase N-terminal domain-containing protein [Actinoplanes bogorensis]MBU2662570.1 GMC family oxidoreductase N-terminal domain-containing protein [Actinoplanes bogorensis]
MNYDFIVCGSGPAGSALAGRLAERPGVSVLLLEAGHTDERPTVDDPSRWVENLGGPAVWDFSTEPSPAVHDRRLFYPMGRVLGGGGSVNGSTWVRGHRDDWDFYARETGDPAWSHKSALEIFDRIEKGPLRITTASKAHPVTEAVLAAADQVGLPRYFHPNGRLMESERGAAPRQEIIHDGRRLSPYRAYVGPRPHANLTVLSGALVLGVLFETIGPRNRAIGVRVRHHGRLRQIYASTEVVLSLGAVQTPKILMLSGVGDAAELAACSIEVRRHLPGVGRNLDDHARFPLPGLRVLGDTRAGCFWNLSSDEPPTFMEVRGGTFHIGMRMRDTGRIRLASADPEAHPLIETGFLTNPADLDSAFRALDTARAIGQGRALRPYVTAAETEQHDVRDTVGTFWHPCGTARMGLDNSAVVDSRLRVLGCEGLRVADASVLPRAPVAGTMAPSVLVGEQAAAFITAEHAL